MDESELSQVLAEALRLYGAQMRRIGGVHPAFKPLLTGGVAVVEVSLRPPRSLRVNMFDRDGYEAEIKNLKRQVKEAKTEIQSLTILLEKQKQDVELLVTEQEPKPEDRVDEPVNCVGIFGCIGANPSDCISLGGHCPTFSQEELDEMVKPKKKRRGRKKPPMEVKKK